MQTQYDAAILQQFADDLYARARWIVFTTTLVYTVVGFGGSAVLAAVVETTQHVPNTVGNGVILFFTLLFCAIGINSGRSKAFRLKLQAQKILCQRQIEINLRPTTQANAAHV